MQAAVIDAPVTLVESGELEAVAFIARSASDRDRAHRDRQQRERDGLDLDDACAILDALSSLSDANPPLHRRVYQAFRLVIELDGVDIRRESQGAQRDPATVQAFVAAHLSAETGWELVIDDDGAGEIADLVLMRHEDKRRIVCLAHCRFSSQPQAGARVADLYERCGQAHKSAR